MTTSEKNHFIQVELQAGSNTPVDYYIEASNTCNQHYGRPNVTGVDPTNTLFGNYMLPTQPAGPNGVTGLYQVHITISYNAAVPTSDITTGKNNSILMQVVGRDGDGTKSLTMKLGPNGTGSGSYNFPLIGKPSTSGESTSVSVPFGLPCNESVPVVHTIGVYDADNGGLFWETLRFKIKDLDWKDPVLSAPGYNPSSADDINFSSGVGGSPNSGNFNTSPFTPDNGNKGQGTVDVRMMPFHRYEIDIYGLDGGNTVVVSLPTDTIFGAIKCAEPPTPSVSCVVNADTPTLVGEVENIHVNGSQNGYNPNPATLRLKLTSITDSNGTSYPTPPYVDVSAPYNNNFPVSGLPPGSYSVTAKISDPNPPAPYSNINNTCPGSFVILAAPYVSIYGGDAEAGVSPQIDNSVYGSYSNAALPGGFYGWNDGVGGSWGSAGAQWAVQALGNIYGFASGRGITSTADRTAPQYLSFANDTNVAAPKYGGLFASSSNVNVNYAAEVNKPGNVKYPAGNKYIDPASVPLTIGTHRTDVVTGGNAYIGGNITYAGSTTWSSPSDIPSYELIVVGGDIYIDRNASHLDGTYVSIYDKSTGTGGNVYTCALTDPILHLMYTRLNVSNTANYGLCQTPLRIYGSVVAKKVNFDRTAGGSYSNQYRAYNTTDAAEAIIYGPEMWLSNAPGGSSNYSAITGLPPIL
jgi:hypothetical protein